mmetsp:Transcript_26196/g.66777  ORF Transcript_26196/g.66777 Transcript_26196/m.66777 type:complete len:271 (-) Transcript_26196:3041-3853(-)
MHKQVLRRPGKAPEHRAVRCGPRQAMPQREPQGGAPVPPAGRRGPPSRLRPRPRARVQDRRVGGVVQVQRHLRRGTAEPCANHPEPERQRRPAVRGRPGAGRAVPHALVRQGRMQGLRAGRVERVGRLHHQVRRPALPASRSQAAGEPLRQAVQCLRGQGDGPVPGLHREVLLRLVAVAGDGRVLEQVRLRHVQPPAAADPVHGEPGRADLLRGRRPEQPVQRQPDRREDLSVQALRERAHAARLQVQRLGRVVGARLRPDVHAQAHDRR